MSTTTDKLALFKYDPSTDGAQTFNIKKALNDNWDKLDDAVKEILITLANKAPAGYGLGGNAKSLTSADDLNAIWESGYYSWHSSSMPKNMPDIKGLVMDAVIMHVCGSGENAYCQEIIPITNGEAYTCANNNKLMRSRYGNVIKGWDWVNPPMQLGVEYRTTERYQGKPVYVKVVDCGALPNNTYKEVAHGVSNFQKGVQAYGEANGLVIPTNNFGGGMAGGPSTVSIRLDGSYVVIATNFDASTYTARVTIKYTKTTD